MPCWRRLGHAARSPAGTRSANHGPEAALPIHVHIQQEGVAVNDREHLSYAAQRLGSTLLFCTLDADLLDQAEVASAEMKLDTLSARRRLSEILPEAIAIIFNHVPVQTRGE
jgi:hypothetical protein